MGEYADDATDRDLNAALDDMDDEDRQDAWEHDFGLFVTQHKTKNTRRGKNMAKQKAKQYPPVKTPVCRVSFPSVFQPRTHDPEGKPLSKPKYEISMLFPKTGLEKDPDFLKMKESIAVLLTDKFGTDRSKWPTPLVFPFKDGNEKAHLDGYKDHIVVRASSINKPAVVDQSVVAIMDPNEFYAGCYAYVTVAPFWWEYMGKQGVSFGLRNVQKFKDGERFGGGTSAEDDFESIPLPDAPAGGAAPAGAAPAGGTIPGLGI